MADVIEWLSSNIQWIFSGVGVAIVSWILVSRKARNKEQVQISGDNCLNIQVGEDFAIDTTELRKEEDVQ